VEKDNLLNKKVPVSLEYFLLSLVIIGGLFGLGYYSFDKQIKKQEELSNKNSELEQKVAVLESNLINIQQESIDLFTMLNEANSKNGSIEEKIQNLSGTVNTLEQLTTLDEELLKKYSKVFFLNEHYAPTDIRRIDPDYLYEPNRNLEIHSEVWPFLKDLIDEANEDGSNLFIASAFRSFGTQTVLKNTYTVTYGAGSANQFSADQGYSEHQLGTTVDFTTKALNGNLNGFDKTPEYKWLQENAHKYGFILSYPSGNTYYKFEPWHWRFVGVELATDLHRENKLFYDEDQRVIDSYLGVMFED
jgi:LAS superfamily LD-carboxypeptidase LdcB